MRVGGGEWVRELGLGFTNTVGIGGVWDVCMCLGCSGVSGVGEGSGWVALSRVLVNGVVLCMCVL